MSSRQPAPGDRHAQLVLLAPHENWVLAGGPNERAVLLDATGRGITRKEGLSTEVLWTAASLRPLVGRVDLITHNHPGGRSIGENDVAVTLLLKAREVNAVTSVRRYRLFHSGHAWPETAEMVETIVQERQRLAREVLTARNQGKINDHDIEQLFHHVLWGRVANRYPDRVSYVVERRG